jgi:hypothetical protein
MPAVQRTFLLVNVTHGRSCQTAYHFTREHDRFSKGRLPRTRISILTNGICGKSGLEYDPYFQ